VIVRNANIAQNVLRNASQKSLNYANSA